MNFLFWKNIGQARQAEVAVRLLAVGIDTSKSNGNSETGNPSFSTQSKAKKE
jgi:hypothetical protein